MTQTPETGQNDQPQTARTVPLTVHAQYIKDLSFENPSAPLSLLPGLPMPTMSVNVTLDAKKLEGQGQVPNTTTYEVLLHIDAVARREQGVVFMVQLDYAVVSSIASNVPEQHHHPLLMVEVPKLAFPFARQILADTTSQAGFPPLLLNPVDFEGMYRDQYLAQAQPANKKAV